MFRGLCIRIAFLTFFLVQHLSAGGDEGRLFKSIVYTQTEASGALLESEPYHFIATVRNSVEDHSASVLVPASGSWSPNPFSAIEPSLLKGAHFVYDQGFEDEASMDQAFPSGEYVFDVARVYDAATTEFEQTVTFTGGAFPSYYPEITNATWTEGVLQLHPANAIIHYTTTGNLSFQWNLVGGGGSGGGSGSSAPGVLDLTSYLRFGQTYSGSLRLVTKESESIVEDLNAGPNAYHRSSTYSAFKATEVRFSIQMATASSGFQILEATFTGGGQSWDATQILNDKIENNSIVYRVDRGELSGHSYYDQYGDLYVKYENVDGTFEVLVTYDFNEWDNYLILPDSSHQVVPLAFIDWAMRYFNATELSDLSIWGLDEDPDGDHLTNIYEFAFGTNPTMADSITPILPQQVTYENESGYKYFGITYRRNKSAQLNFSVLHSLNLETWAPLFPAEIVKDISGELALEQVSAFSSLSMELLDQQFLQLVITDPNPPPVAFPFPDLSILEATYGADGSFNDVNGIIEAAIIDDSVSLVANNSTMGGDPIFGAVKQLFVRYTYNGTEYTKMVQEGETLILP